MRTMNGIQILIPIHLSLYIKNLQPPLAHMFKAHINHKEGSTLYGDVQVIEYMHTVKNRIRTKDISHLDMQSITVIYLYNKPILKNIKHACELRVDENSMALSL